MQRFYFSDLESGDESITIQNKDLLNQLIQVLRVKNGDKISFFNGVEPYDYIYEIKGIGKKDIFLIQVGVQEVESEIGFDLTLFNALPNKLDKIEDIIQKGTQIGITGFYFFRSSRSQKLVLSQNKQARLQKIMIEAVEQSGRSRVPELILEENISLGDFQENENIFFHTQDRNSLELKQLDVDITKGVNLFVGPEGGWTEDEVEAFESLKFQRVHLGNRILRTETTGASVAFYMIQKLT